MHHAHRKRQKTAQRKHVGPGRLQRQRAECGAGRVQGRDRRRQLVVGDVFLDTTLRNLAANDGRIAISVYDAKTLEGYQIRGTAEHVADGPVVATFKAMVEQMFQGAAAAKGALIITPETVVVTMPGAENKKVL